MERFLTTMLNLSAQLFFPCGDGGNNSGRLGIYQDSQTKIRSPLDLFKLIMLRPVSRPIQSIKMKKETNGL